MMRVASSGNGRDCWKRTLLGITPWSRSRQNTLYEASASVESAQKYLEMAQQRTQSAGPSDQQAQLDLALAHNQVSDVQVESGNFEQGLINARQSLALFEQLQAAAPSNRRYRRAVAIERKRIGGIYEYSGKLDEALAENPGDSLARRDLAISYTSVADVLLKKGQTANALKLYR